jgi:hypothetical protein
VDERICFAFERSGSPRHRSHVAQLFSLGSQSSYYQYEDRNHPKVFEQSVFL